jgi:predicted Zn-dependent protease
MLEAYARNRSTPAALQDCFQVDPQQIEFGYREFLAKVVARSVSEDRPLPTLDRIRADLAERPEDAELWSQLAAVHLAGGRKSQADRCASAALRLQRGEPLAGLVMARIHLDSGDIEAAIAILEESLDAETPDLRVVVLLAELQLENQNFDQAERLYRIGQRCQPDADLWPKSLARVYLKSGNPRKLTQVLDRLTRMEYDNLLLRKKLLDLARTEGDAGEIRRWAESVLQIDVADTEAHAALAGLTSGDGDSAALGNSGAVGDRPGGVPE